MFVPVYVNRNVFDSSAYGSNPDSVARNELCRLSTASSDASFGCLKRHSSTSSNASVSTAASSTPSVKDSPRPKHRKTFSNSSITRRLLQKSRPQEAPRKNETAPTSSPVTVSAPPVPAPAPSPASNLSPSPADEGKASDLVVRCRSDVYHVDRVIMCYHSRWFARVCAVVMSPKSSKGAIDLSADDPSAVAAMMQYCYQLDYTDQLAGSDIEVPEDVTLRSHVNVYMLAERYGVSGLKTLALEKFKEFAAMVLIVDGNQEQLLHAIRAMYAPDRRANADDLRRVAVKLCADHVQEFIHDTGKTMSLVKAFHLPNDPYRKALRSLASSSAASTPQPFYTSTVQFDCNKENHNPFHDTKADFTKALSGPQEFMRLQLSPRFLDCYSKHHHSSTTSTQGGCSMPLSELGHLQINSSPPGFTADPGSSSPLDDVLGSYPYFQPGPAIFEDPDAMYSQDNHTGRVTPTALYFRDLSLQDVPDAPLASYQPPIAAARTNVFMVESASLQHCFPNIQPEEVAISFNKGKQVMKIDKYVLSNASRFFAPMLDGPTFEGHTRCIRLRGDFPYAITAMIQYMEDGVYTFDPDMRVKYPKITLLDLHIHAYIVGARYGVPKLCDHAIDEYLNIGKMILSMGIHVNGDEATSFSALQSQDAQTSPVSSVIDSFLDSFVLIWRNTPSREDALRDATIDLLKPQLHQLMRLKFFQTLMMEMVGFGDDIVHSLAEDGFDVKAFLVLAGLQKNGGVRFAGAFTFL
ncbi:btb poz-like protein [Stemphylium lycopersici]|nr:btb poz-like protein [Stemphylium lycopersici]